MSTRPATSADLSPATVTALGAGQAPPTWPRSLPTPQRRRTEPVSTTRVPPAALRAALLLAGGDHTRLRLAADGTVTVANTAR